MISRRVFLGRAGEIAAFGAIAGAELSPLASGRTKSGGGARRRRSTWKSGLPGYVSSGHPSHHRRRRQKPSTCC